MKEAVNAEKSSRLTAFVCVCYSAVAVFIAGLSLSNLVKETHGAEWLLYAVFSILLLTAAAAVLIRSGNRLRRFGLILFVASFLLKSGFALAVNTQPESDFFLFYTAAQSLAGGVNNMLEYSYFVNWPYQSAFVAWMALFIKLFGADLVFFKLMNCLFSALTTLLIYIVAKRFASERGARVAAVVFMLYPGTFLMIPVLTNQHLSEFLLLAAVCVYSAPASSGKRRIALSAAAALLLALSNAIRPMSSIAILAAVAYLLIRAVSWFRARRDKLWLLFLRTAVLVLVYFLMTAGMSELAKVSGLNEYGLVNNVPEWKIIVGLNQESGGVYNIEDEIAVFGEGVDQEAAAEELMRERLNISIYDFLGLGLRKSLLLWGAFEPTWWAFTESVYAEGSLGSPGELARALEKTVKLSSGIYIWANLLIALGVLVPLRKKRIHEACALLMLLALAYFCAHLFVEVQTRYRSLMTAVSFPLIASGVDAVLLGYKRLRLAASARRQGNI